MADQLNVQGAVAAPLSLTTLALASEFAPVAVTLVNGDVYGGVSVYSLLTAAQFLYPTGATVKNGSLRDYVTATAASGSQVLLSEGEIDPGFGGAASTDIIAYQRNNVVISPELIVPGDVNGGIGGRDLSGVVALSVGIAAIPAALPGQPSAPPLMVSGDVGTPANPYTAASLQQVGAVQQTDTFAAGTAKTTTTFTGASLQSVLNSAGVSNVQASDQYITATGSDGYGVVYSRAEIDPATRTAPTALIAYNDGSGVVPSVGGVGGALRTTAPGDAKGGRYVSNLADVAVARPQEDTVFSLFEGAFNRAPDSAGSAAWSSYLASGASIFAAAQGLLGSAEFQTDGGAAFDNSGFVNRLYQGDLGRAPDAAGLAAWKGLLDGGATRANVLAYFASTPEVTLHAAMVKPT